MAGDAQVRDAVPDDLPWIAQLVRDSFDPPLLPYLVAAQHGIVDWWRLVLEHPGSFGGTRILVAESPAGGRLGYAELKPLGQTTGFLSYVAITPQARGAGVAATLLSAWLCEQPECEAMELDVFAGNATARRLYERLGFTETSRSTWWAAELPPRLQGRADHEGIIADLHAAMARHRVYGFTDLTATTLRAERLRLGVLGTQVLRHFTAQAFIDEEAHAIARALFPDIARSFAILPAGVRPPPSSGAEPFNESLRLRSDQISHLRERT